MSAPTLCGCGWMQSMQPSGPVIAPLLPVDLARNAELINRGPGLMATEPRGG